MIWWILLGGLVVGIIVLVLAVWPVLARLPALRRALDQLQRRAEEAEALQSRMESLQEHLERLEREIPARPARS